MKIARRIRGIWVLRLTRGERTVAVDNSLTGWVQATMEAAPCGSVEECGSTEEGVVMKRMFLLLVGLAVLAPALVLGGQNPPAPGFDLEGSDAEAILVADRVMDRMGGRAAWDSIRFVSWKFFGRRMHYWDKYSGDIRVEGVGREDQKPYLILMNLHSLEGRAWRDGQELEGEELAKMLDSGEAAWINDSYWMFMPYKLKDSGVTLEYVGEGTMADERAAEVLQLTFKEVGRTPDNRYLVYVAKDSGLVEQWDYFSHADDEEPGFRIPWHNWKPFGGIMLSDDRGDSGHTDLGVYDHLPESVFTSPEPVDLSTLQ